MIKFILPILLFFSSIPVYSKCNNEILKGHIYEVQLELANELKDEFGLYYNCGYSFPHDAAMQLQLFNRVTLEEARHLVVYIAERLSKKIDTDERIRPYLGKCLSYPYDISIRISFCNPIDGYQGDGTIGHVSLVKSRIHYRADDAFTSRYVYDYEEPYEEAVRIVESTYPHKPSLHQNTPLEAAFDAITSQYTLELAQQLRLYVSNIGREKGDRLERVDIRMTRYKKTKEKSARALIVMAVEKLLAMINSNEALSPHGNTSFSADQIRMRINFRDDNCCYFNKNSLESVVIEDGKVTYFDKKHSERTPILSESYLEAKGRVF